MNATLETSTEEVESLRSKQFNQQFSQPFDQVIQAKAANGPVRAAIFAHPFPDPDAIASQMGVAWLLRTLYNIDSDLFFEGEISHPQNGAVDNLLEPNLRRVNEEYIPTQYELNILVDTVPRNACTGKYKDEIQFDVVIDHHKDAYINGYKGLFLHLKTGACASIIYNLIKGLVPPTLWFNKSIELDCRVSTALIAGVITDTEYMLSDDSTDLEIETFQDLLPYRSQSDLREIIFFKRPKSWIELTALACREANIDTEGIAIVGLGIIPEKQRDIVAAVADDMIMWASVETAVAFALVGGDRIVGSVRSNNSSFQVAETCKKLGGKFGSGGGKHGKGAYHYSLAGFAIDEEEEDFQKKMWDVVKEKENKRVSRILKQ